MYCRLLSSHPGLYPLNTSSTPPPTHKYISRYYQMSPEEQNCPQLRVAGIELESERQYYVEHRLCSKDCLGSNFSSATSKLCDLGELLNISVPWCSSSVNWEG